MLTRKTYARLALAFGVFAVYGSLVPLEFQAVPFEAAVGRFAAIPYLQLGVDSRADFVANILLFVPLGFLCCGGLRADRRGAGAGIAAAIVVVGACLALSVAIEFTQIFFPPRTVSINDILAETIGAMVGAAAWFMCGMFVTVWVREFFRERSRPTLVVHVLTVYAVLFVISQLLPLDLAISPADLADKYRGGRIILQPLGFAYDSTFNMVWDLAADIVTTAPVGAVAVLGWTRHGRRRSAAGAFALGVGIVAALELAQLFVFSRVADVTDLATGSAGIALGVVAAVRIGCREAAVGGGADRLRLWPLCGAAVWLVVVLAHSWYPFDFVLDPALVRDRMPMFLGVPFRNYYFGSEFHAFTELTRKFLLALPLGAVFRIAWPASPDRRIAWLQTGIVSIVLLGLFTAIEVGQLFLPDRVADFTDVLISQAGAALGIYLVGLLMSAPPVQVAKARV